MPELPEVETMKKGLEGFLPGKKIERIQICDPRVIRNRSPQVFKRQLIAKTFTQVGRRGKAIILCLADGDLCAAKHPQSVPQTIYLVIQPMMTGQLITRNAASLQGFAKATKLIFIFSDGSSLLYNDQRMFGRLTVVGDLVELPFLKTIGPEPLERDFSVRWLKAALKRRTLPIKSLLLDQRFIAGIGNIYAAEILYRCRIHPLRRANTLSAAEMTLLVDKTKQVLKQAIRERGTSVINYRDTDGKKGNFIRRIRVYGRQEQRCFRCQQPIQRIVQSGRSTFFCGVCQT